MKNALVALLTFGLLVGQAAQGHASDWDKAGKALTIIEGLRLFTGGRIDVVGKIGEVATGRTYTNKASTSYPYDRHRSYPDDRPYKRIVRHYRCTQERTWVPEYRWTRKCIPEHEEFDEKFGTVVVEEHYIKIKEEHGGHWEYEEVCD